MSDPDPDDITSGLTRLEGHLMHQAALRRAQEEGEAFARGLSWLGPDEQHEVATRFVRHHMRTNREMLTTLHAHGQALKAPYRTRCRQLQLCLVALCCCAFIILILLGSLFVR